MAYIGHFDISATLGSKSREELLKELVCDDLARASLLRAPKDHTSIRILQSMISGIALILGLGTRT